MGAGHGDEGNRRPRGPARRRPGAEAPPGGQAGPSSGAAAAQAEAGGRDLRRPAAPGPREEEVDRRARPGQGGRSQGRHGYGPVAARRLDVDRSAERDQPSLRDSPNGLPSESLQIEMRSPGWTTPPPSASTRSTAAAMSATSK